jgi:hypothetical protein
VVKARGITTAIYKIIWHLGPEVAGYWGVAAGLAVATATGLSDWRLHVAQGVFAGFIGENLGYYGILYLQLRFIPLGLKRQAHAVTKRFPERPGMKPIVKEIALAYGAAELTDWLMRPLITTWVMASLARPDSFVSHAAQVLSLGNEALLAKGFAEVWFYSLVILTALLRWGWRRRRQHQLPQRKLRPELVS